MQNHNDTIRTSDTVLRKIYLSLYWKGCVWEGVRDRTELQHIDPHSIGHNCVSFPFSWAAQPGAWGQALWVLVFSIASYLQLVWSPKWFHLQLQLLNRGPEDPLCWVLAFSTASCLRLTDFLSSPIYIIVHANLLLVGVTIALIQPIHGQGYNSDIPRPDAPVIYTGAFPILIAWPGQYTTIIQGVSSWFNGYSNGLRNRSKRVYTPVAILRLLSGKYPWERYETSYPPSYGLNSTTTVLLGE